MKNRTPRCLAWIPILLFPFLANCFAQQDSPDGPGKPGAGVPASADGRPANRLKDATSPYLLQHAHNPVDWYPWGEEAFKKARDEDKPIFLSVGYSACHWCHVMERECFENEELAKQLNASFVAIKVDREERPDIDELYMRYLHLSGRNGGWPMSVFLTPDGEPFFGGTYFPPRPFVRIMSGLSEAWGKKRDQIIRTARDGADALRENANAEYRTPERPLSSETSTRAVAMLRVGFTSGAATRYTRCSDRMPHRSHGSSGSKGTAILRRRHRVDPPGGMCWPSRALFPMPTGMTFGAGCRPFWRPAPSAYGPIWTTRF